MIIVRIWEGIGNQLFQYAYARAFELSTGQKVYMDVERCFSDELEGKRTQRVYQLDNFRTKMKIYPRTKELFFFLHNQTLIEKIMFEVAQSKKFFMKYIKEDEVSYKKELMQLSGCCYVMGWFQNENYFKEYRNVLIKELTPKKKIQITPCLKTILSERNTVSMHIRRGDYKRLNFMLPISYYEDAMEYIRRKVKNPIFLIFSDDIQWVKTNIQFKDETIYISKEEKLEDYEELLLMSKCKHNIIANSSFSWWGAWLNTNAKKIVVGPNRWFGTIGRNAGYNIMPSEWVRI